MSICDSAGAAWLRIHKLIFRKFDVCQMQTNLSNGSPAIASVAVQDGSVDAEVKRMIDRMTRGSRNRKLTDKAKLLGFIGRVVLSSDQSNSKGGINPGPEGNNGES